LIKHDFTIKEVECIEDNTIQKSQCKYTIKIMCQ
jgi:hypothetical protein